MLSCCNNLILLLQVFTGNSNTYIAELREVRPPIVARKIRIVPYSTHKRTLCMRVEIYGCVWKGGSQTDGRILAKSNTFTMRAGLIWDKI